LSTNGISLAARKLFFDIKPETYEASVDYNSRQHKVIVKRRKFEDIIIIIIIIIL